MVWDPGGGEKAASLPASVIDGLRFGDDSVDSAHSVRPWIRMPARGHMPAGDYEWMKVREWMSITHSPHLPAWDNLGLLVEEDGVLTEPPYLGAMHADTRGAVLWDILWTRVRRELIVERDSEFRRSGRWLKVTADRIRERVSALHAAPTHRPASLSPNISGSGRGGM